MRLTKQEFFDRLGGAAVGFLLTVAKTEVAVEAWIKRLDLTTPDPDGTSVDLSDPRTIEGVNELGAMMVSLGVVDATWVNSVLSSPAVEEPQPVVLPSGVATVYRLGANFMTCLAHESAPESFDERWEVDALYYALIQAGATLRAEEGKLAIAKQVG